MYQQGGPFLAMRGPFIAAAGGVPPVPVTNSFTVAQVTDAFFGFFDKTASHSSVASWDWYSDQSTLTFYARGTECKVNLYQALANGFSYSIDDGAWTLCGGGAGFADFTLFTGLTDTEHLVRLVSSVGYNGGGAATRASGNIVTITGVTPSVRPVGTMYHALDPALPGQWIGLTSAAIGAPTTPAYRVPSLLVPAVVANTQQFSFNNSNFTLRGRGSEIWIFSAVPRARYAVDGADWSDVTFPANLGERSCMRRVASGLDASTDHTYRVIGSLNTSFGGKPTYGMALGPYSTATYGTAPTETRIIMVGDSITQAMNAAGQYTGNGDLFISAQALGCVGLHIGKGGQQVVSGTPRDSLVDNIDAILAVTSVFDVGILAIGANDGGTSEAAFKAAYQTCVEKIRDASTTGKVLCRGITPSGASVSTWISDVVTTMADPDIVFIDTTTWTGIATFDGQHPTDAGFITMAGYEETAYAPYV
jgi:hypothetical protein